MAKVYGWFEYDDSLTPGQSEDGGLSQLLFNSEGKLADHATFHPDDHDESDGFPADDSSNPNADAEAAALLVLAVLAAAVSYAAIRKAAPHVQRLIKDHALPGVQRFWNKVRGLGIREAPSVMNLVTASQAEAGWADDGITKEPGSGLASLKPTMSAEEWYARFRAMFEARSFAEEQWRLLSSVRVEDDEAIEALQLQMMRNKPDAVVQRVTRMLEASNRTLFEEHGETHPIELGIEAEGR